MRVLFRFTWASLRKNRARTAVTILGILLSMTLFTAVLAGAASGRNWLLENEIARSGAWEGFYVDLDGEQTQSALSREFIKDASVWTDVGWAEFPNENEYRPYLFIQSVDSRADQLVSIRLRSGRLPQDETEILLPSHLETLGNVKLREGDTLDLQVGVRMSAGSVATEETGYFTGGEGEEELTDTVAKTYRVVGIYERLDMSIENFGTPAYTALTTGSSTDIGLSTVFFTTGDPSGFYETAGADPVFAGQLRPHSDLLMLSGATKDAGFLQVLYGMAAILIILIVFGSISLIYNSFSISISERFRSYGILRSVGATRRQVRLTVLMESLILCGIGIPLGLGLGLLGLWGVLTYLQRDFSAVFGASLSYVPIRLSFSLPTLLMAVLICLLTTLVSALIPAHKAIRASAIDAIRQTGEVRYRTASGGSFSGKLFGFAGTLAGRNYVRSRRKYVVTILSLALSLVLFISAASFGDYLRSYLNVTAATDTGADLYLTGTGQDQPAQKVLEEIRGLRHVDEACANSAAYVEFFVPRKACTQEFLDSPYADEVRPEDGAVPGEEDLVGIQGFLQFVDDDSFEAVCRENNQDSTIYTKADRPTGIILNHIVYRAYDEGRQAMMRYSVDVLKEADTALNWYSGEELDDRLFRNVTVDKEGIHVWYQPEEADGAVPEDIDLSEDHPERLITVELQAGALSEMHPWIDAGGAELFSIICPASMAGTVLPENCAEKGSFSTEFMVRAADHAAAAGELEKYADESGTGGSVYDRAAQKETARMALKILTVFATCFILLMALISAVNVFNTISTNIRLRRREFAVLRSVGMGDRDFSRMMHCESLLYVTRSLILGLTLAYLFTYAIYKVIGQNLIVGFYVPWYAVLIAVALVVVIVFVTAGRAVRQLKGRDLAAELKLENT